MEGEGTPDNPLVIDRLPDAARRRIRASFRQLQREFPTLYPTSLRFVDLVDGDKDMWGVTTHSRRKDKHRLRIDVALWLSEEAAFYVALHEYAHAMVWRAKHQEEDRVLDHDPEWGLAFAKCWALCCELDRVNLC